MKKKVLVGGTFNSIHPGHIYFLNEAKKLGDELAIVLTHDRNNKKPYAILAVDRKKNLEFLEIADKIFVGEPRDMAKVLKTIKPDVIALGYDQKMPAGLEKIKFVRIKKLGDYSTRKTKIIG